MERDAYVERLSLTLRPLVVLLPPSSRVVLDMLIEQAGDAPRTFECYLLVGQGGGEPLRVAQGSLASRSALDEEVDDRWRPKHVEEWLMTADPHTSEPFCDWLRVVRFDARTYFVPNRLPAQFVNAASRSRFVEVLHKV